MRQQWQDSEYVLKQFSDNAETARTLYRSFVAAGISEGRRNDLVGGGLIRSNKGWRPIKGADHRKSDERILGGSDFVLEVMKTSQETWERSHALKIDGVDFAAVRDHTARLFDLNPEELLLPGKYRTPRRCPKRPLLFSGKRTWHDVHGCCRKARDRSAGCQHRTGARGKTGEGEGIRTA